MASAGYLQHALGVWLLAGLIGGSPFQQVAVDAGIVHVERRPYIFSMMTTYLNQRSEGNGAIERASRRVFDYFSRLARSSGYGRRIR
jgi:hypothetical protein